MCKNFEKKIMILFWKTILSFFILINGEIEQIYKTQYHKYCNSLQTDVLYTSNVITIKTLTVFYGTWGAGSKIYLEE